MRTHIANEIGAGRRGCHCCCCWCAILQLLGGFLLLPTIIASSFFPGSCQSSAIINKCLVAFIAVLKSCLFLL